MATVKKKKKVKENKEKEKEKLFLPIMSLYWRTGSTKKTAIVTSSNCKLQVDRTKEKKIKEKRGLLGSV